MNDATTTNPCPSCENGQNGQSLRMVERKTVRRDTPARTSGTTGTVDAGNVIQILKRKRDRYKGRDKMIQARTVQACIDELLGVWK